MGEGEGRGGGGGEGDNGGRGEGEGERERGWLSEALKKKQDLPPNKSTQGGKSQEQNHFF